MVGKFILNLQGGQSVHSRPLLGMVGVLGAVRDDAVVVLLTPPGDGWLPNFVRNQLLAMNS